MKNQDNNATVKDNDFYDDDFYENQPLESCPKCGRFYDHIDFDFQSCSKCGWDAENNRQGQAQKPTEQDYQNGDADLLTGRWY